MHLSTRLFVAVTIIAFVTCLVAIFAPEVGQLGPPPSTETAVDWLMQGLVRPVVLAPAMLALVLFAWVKTRPFVEGRLRAPSHLSPVPGELTSVQKLMSARASFYVKAKGSDGMTLGELVVHAAVRVGASDIHLQPDATGASIALRVDGVLQPFAALSGTQYPQLVNRIKVLAQLTHFVSDKPQDGTFTMPTPEGPAQLRVSMLPTQHGEKVVLRLAKVSDKGPSFSELNLPDSVRSQLGVMLNKPQGLIFFTGPVGSGKTTTIYASIAHLQHARGTLAQIATIEDPIERTIVGIAQTQVNRAAQLDFATGLRALLRQDPNVLVVGEIRDTETAHIATQAALTGHLILTTVHADSAPGVFNRMLEMGVEPSVLSSVALASFSQRLMRRLCPHCRVPEPPSEQQQQLLDAWSARAGSYFTAPGCEHCGGTGLAGRTAVFEVLVMTDELREAIANRPSTQQLQSIAMGQGMMGLREAALKRARDGEVSLAEAIRVAG